MKSLIKTVFLKLLACFLGNSFLFTTEPENMDYSSSYQQLQEELYKKFKEGDNEWREDFIRECPLLLKDLYQRYEDLREEVFFRTEPEKMAFPPIEKRFEELYQELKKEEDELLEKFKNQYPNVPQDAWQRYYQLPQEAFAAIKKEYAGTPACNGLPENVDLKTLPNQEFEGFFKQYTQCAAERNGIDPKKINIFYKHTDHEKFEDKQESYTSRAGFSFYSRVRSPYYELVTNKKEYAPSLLINIPSFKDNMISYSDTPIITLIDKAMAEIALGNNRFCFLNYIVKRYHDTDNWFTELKNETDLMHQNHAYIVAAMQSEYVLNTLLTYAQDPNKKPFVKKDYDWPKMVRYLLKIKQIIHG